MKIHFDWLKKKKMKCLVVVVIVLIQLVFSRSILEEYVNRPDDSFGYTLHSTFSYPAGTAYVLNVTSHTWLTTKEVSHPVWKHWVIIAVPRNLKHLKPLFVIGGGGRTSKAPTAIPTEFALISGVTESILVVLTQIPYQPVSFPSAPRPRVEDGSKKKKNLF